MLSRLHLLGLAFVFLTMLGGTAHAYPGDPPSAPPAPEESKSEEEKENQTPAPTPQPRRPAFQNIRLEEDWSGFSSPDGGWDRLKNIPLGHSGKARATFGGQLRLRSELWDDFGFGGAGNRDDAFGLLRLRLHGDFWLNEHLRFFVEGKSSLATGRNLPGGNRAIDTDSADLQSALVEIRPYAGEAVSLSLRAGRQELQYGRQRLVSPLDWVNTRRTFDGFKGILHVPGWQIDGFWSKLARVRKYRLNTHDTDTDFFGIYAAGSFKQAGQKLDLYWLGLSRDRNVSPMIEALERRHTFGVRYQAQASQSVSLETEAAGQLGSASQFNRSSSGRTEQDIQAFMLSTQINWTPPNVKMSPGFSMGFDYASGDGDPGDGKVGTFSQLFPLGHAYLGFIDIVGRQNVIDLSPSFHVKPFSKLMIRTDGHFFWRASLADGLYDAGAGLARSGSLSNSRHTGSEIDLTLRSALDRHTVLMGGYSRFFAGGFIQDTGSAKDIQLVYVSVEFTF